MKSYLLPAVMVVLVGCLYLQAQQKPAAPAQAAPVQVQRWEYARMTESEVENKFFLTFELPGAAPGSGESIFKQVGMDYPKLDSLAWLAGLNALGRDGWEVVSQWEAKSSLSPERDFLLRRPLP